MILNVLVLSSVNGTVPRSYARVHPVAAILVVFASCCLGCQQNEIERATISGTITLDGEPIPKGQIRFVPTNGPVWSAWIANGVYTTEGTKGVPIGDLQVRIEAYRTPSWYKGGKSPDDETPLEQYLPKKYNSLSELKMTVEPGAGAKRISNCRRENRTAVSVRGNTVCEAAILGTRFPRDGPDESWKLGAQYCCDCAPLV